MKVLIIPEDQTQDGFIAKPVIAAIFDELGIHARVEVLPEPRLRGSSDALDGDLLREIVDANRMVDLFILVVDLDCDRMNHSTKAAEREREHPGKLFACLAQQELEVWMLALHREKLRVSWSDVRSECDPKERWAEPLLKELGSKGPGGGRKRAMDALKGNIRSLLSLCGELQALKDRVENFK